MFVSSTLTIGQATFILRALIQGLLFGGLFLLGLIIFSYAPRVGLSETHDVLNRIVGQITVTTSSAKWVLWRITGKSKGHPPSASLTLAIALFLFYAIFISISDVSFIGFQSCTIPSPDRTDFPASIGSNVAALDSFKSALVNASDLPRAQSFRCDSSELFASGPNVTLTACNAWRNSTYDNPDGFRDLNTTDSDSLIPRRLLPDRARSTKFYMNYVIRGIEGVQRVNETTIQNGTLVMPHATGVRAIFGVPNLRRNDNVYIPKTFAVEADVGCMSTGILAEKDILLGYNGVTTYFQTSDDWRQYSGPDYLRGALARSVDKTREYLRPMFNETSPDGLLYTTNTSFNHAFRYYDSVSNYYFPYNLPNEYEDSVIGNCTNDIMQQLGIPAPPKERHAYPDYCNFLEIGSSQINQKLYQGIRKLVCATATNITMVSATVQVSSNGTVSMNMTRLPSSMNTIYADYWEVRTNVSGFDPQAIVYDRSDGVLRFTLSDDPNGNLSHPILQETASFESGNMIGGAGSPGFVFSKLGPRMLKVQLTTETQLGILDNDYYSGNLSPARVTRWAGEMGASYLLGSLAYNGWVARNRPALTVVSSGGKAATCFDLKYGIAFLPLLLSAVVIIVWALLTLLRGSFALNGQLKEMYGGLAPYGGAVSSSTLPPDSVLAWEKNPRLHLEVVRDGQLVKGAGKESLVECMDQDDSKFFS